MIKDSGFRLRTVALVACCGALLVGCGGGGSTTPADTERTPPTTEESPQAKQRTAITTAVTNAETAVSRVTDPTTDAQITAAEKAITALNTAINNAEDLPPTELEDFKEDLGTLRGQLNIKKESRSAAQTAQTTTQQTTQRTAITRASTTATAAVAEVENDATDAQVTAAENAIAALNNAIDNAEDLPPTELAAFRVTRDALTASLNKAKTSRTTAQTTESRQATQRTTITDAVTAAREAIDAVEDNDAEDVTEADEAINALNTAIGDAEDLPATEIQAFRGTLEALTGRLNTAKTSRTDADEEEQQMRKAANDAEAEAEAEEQARKLFNVIKVDNNAAVSYDTTGDIKVTYADNNSAPLTTKDNPTDKKGWVPKNYTDGQDRVVTEAVVYAYLAPTPGSPFNKQYENALDSEGFLLGDNFTAALVEISGVVPTTNYRDFPGRIERAGKYHGVPGTYTCSYETSDADNKCRIGLVGSTPAEGLELTSGATPNRWKFEPKLATTPVEGTPDNEYASYGWWSYKPPGADWEVQAFHKYRAGETPPALTGFSALTGTARYTGSATGWYALYSATGGTNNSGNFTASVRLQAAFGSSTEGGTINGTIDSFKGEDGNSLVGWKVDLKKNSTDIPVEGAITGGAADWSINGKTPSPGCAECNWEGRFYESDTSDNNTPRVVTGSFYTEFGKDGKMVGSFGTNKQQ